MLLFVAPSKRSPVVHVFPRAPAFTHSSPTVRWTFARYVRKRPVVLKLIAEPTGICRTESSQDHPLSSWRSLTLAQPASGPTLPHPSARLSRTDELCSIRYRCSIFINITKPFVLRYTRRWENKQTIPTKLLQYLYGLPRSNFYWLYVHKLFVTKLAAERIFYQHRYFQIVYLYGLFWHYSICMKYNEKCKIIRNRKTDTF